MSNPVGLYIVDLVVQLGDVILSGAPTLTLKLVVNAPTGHINGTASITQALPPPHGALHFPVSGVLHHTGFGVDTRLIALHGTYFVAFPPPAIGSIVEHFSAALAVDAAWNGVGTYTYGHYTVSHAQVIKEG